ncbi:response regulator [Salinimicrobium sp. HB62]|uniref:response regulator n=1 Tax=Salinimicrobium sp. HB62 TaxID=3077781 RepID=UPI002D776A2A|nr:response regulator [Salinimicrobium sp. HB62]
MNVDVIVIDDDAVVLFLHKVLIKKSKLPSSVRDFLKAEDALHYLNHRTSDNNLLIFLDINMPNYNGWDFLDQIEDLPYKESIFVVMVTSSINESDRNTAKGYARVIDYREKPLSKQACEEVYFKLLPLLKS